jgi:copper homeostasis protein
MKVEICANSFESALAAQDAGAHRIELCQELSLGGITPSHGLIEKVMQELEIPVFVLIRPRSGDFMYSEADFDVMLRDIAFAKAQGAQGIVSGVLNTDFTIDAERTKQLIAECGELPFTFHRAFDWTPDVLAALELLIDMGAQRILTSGMNVNVNEGYETLLQLLAAARNRIGILPGGGISIDNVMKFKNAGFSEVHGSLSSSTVG